MNLLELRTAIQESLQDDGVYRLASQLNTGINDGYFVVCLASMCDERSSTLLVNGSRNFNALPTDGNAYCFAPIAVIDAVTGHRLGPSKVDQFDFYNASWEGIVDSSSQYYTILNQYETSRTILLTCPIQNYMQTYLKIYGAYIPEPLSADTDTPRIESGFHDLLVNYGRFHGLIGEPGLAVKAAQAYSLFTSRLGEFVATVKARFPSGRDYEPWPIEFNYSGITVQEQAVAPQEQKSEGQ